MNQLPVDAALPLSGYSTFTSSNFDTVKHALCCTLTPHRLRRISGDVPVHGRINTANLAGMRFHAMRVGPAVEVLPTILESFFMLHMPAFGSTRFSIGESSFETGCTAAAVMSPGLPIRAMWEEECCAVLLCIGRSPLERHLEHLIGYRLNAPLRFAPVLELESAAGQPWQRLWNYVVRELEAPRLGNQSALRDAETARLVMSTMLSAARHNYSAALDGATQDACPRSVLLAEAFMRTRVVSPPTAAEIAVAAGVAPRTLHKAFIRYRGCSLMRTFRNMRLDGARDDLLSADPAATVTEVALQWGFTELGRFAVEYRHRHGELPSQTRRRPPLASRI